jgi:hypothetical protein
VSLFQLYTGPPKRGFISSHNTRVRPLGGPRADVQTKKKTILQIMKTVNNDDNKMYFTDRSDKENSFLKSTLISL